MTRRNDEIPELWAYGLTGRSNHMWTENGNLYSYNLRIGYTTKYGTTVLYLYASHNGKGRFVSMTTSQHVSLAVRWADVVIHPDTRERIYQNTIVMESLETEE